MKTLVTANDVRDSHVRGETRLVAPRSRSIITPEAREVAEALGLVLVEDDTVSAPAGG